MTIGESWVLKHVADDDLLRGIVGLVSNERRALAAMLAHLAEVEDRRLHLKIGCSSLFDYCLRRLGLSEGEAFRRVTGARLARRFPVVFGLVARGDIHLSALCQLRDYLTSENHQGLLQEASYKTKKQVEELLARRSPKPEVQSMIRRLPAPTTVSVETLTSASREEWAGERAGTEGMVGPAHEHARPVTLSRSQPAAIVEPLSEERYRLQLNASAELKRKLELARDLMSHANPHGDLAIVVERALELLVEKLQRERFAQTPVCRASDTRANERRVSNATRRAVVARDGLQCSYVSPDGERCPSRRFLQFHHEQAWALGGQSDAENVRVLCASHNQLLGERDFGREHMERARTKRSAKA
jgi:hypothetical protein